MAPDDTALILLAAGRSERFGSGASKLDQDLAGLPLGLHVVARLASIPFRTRIAVVGRAAIDYAAHGFETVVNGDPGWGMSHSIALGVARAAERGVNGIVIALADMPMVDAVHVRRLFASDGDIVASFDGIAPKPPVRFAASRFAELSALGEQAGARDLIRHATRVSVDPSQLIDIDTPVELARLRDLLSEPPSPPAVRPPDTL